MKDFVTHMLIQGVNHASSKAIVEAMDFFAGFSEEDVKEWTALLDSKDAERFQAVWRACKGMKETVAVSARPIPLPEP